MLLIAKHISDLSTARFFSGEGVEMMSFVMKTTETPKGINPQDIAEITQWLFNVKILVHLPTDINYLDQLLQHITPDFIIVKKLFKDCPIPQILHVYDIDQINSTQNYYWLMLHNVPKLETIHNSYLERLIVTIEDIDDFHKCKNLSIFAAAIRSKCAEIMGFKDFSAIQTLLMAIKNEG